MYYFTIVASGCNPPGGGGSSDPCLISNITFGTVQLKLNKVFKTGTGGAPNRDASYPPPQPPHPWTGSDPSAILYPSAGLWGAYFCKVVVSSPDCSSFHEEYVWDTNLTTKTISVPSNITFMLKVMLFEPCGDFYNNSNVNYETEWKWISSEYMDIPTSQISNNPFTFVQKKYIPTNQQ